DLVVEASGRSSKLSLWLSSAGYELPEDERISAGIGYSTRYYKVPSQKKDASVSIIIVEGSPATGNSAGGVLKRIENDIWAVCLTGIGGQHPPTDAGGFDEGL